MPINQSSVKPWYWSMFFLTHLPATHQWTTAQRGHCCKLRYPNCNAEHIRVILLHVYSDCSTPANCNNLSYLLSPTKLEGLVPQVNHQNLGGKKWSSMHVIVLREIPLVSLEWLIDRHLWFFAYFKCVFYIFILLFYTACLNVAQEFGPKREGHLDTRKNQVHCYQMALILTALRSTQ